MGLCHPPSGRPHASSVGALARFASGAPPVLWPRRSGGPGRRRTTSRAHGPHCWRPATRDADRVQSRHPAEGAGSPPGRHRAIRAASPQAPGLPRSARLQSPAKVKDRRVRAPFAELTSSRSNPARPRPPRSAGGTPRCGRRFAPSSRTPPLRAHGLPWPGHNNEAGAPDPAGVPYSPHQPATVSGACGDGGPHAAGHPKPQLPAPDVAGSSPPWALPSTRIAAGHQVRAQVDGRCADPRGPGGG